MRRLLAVVAAVVLGLALLTGCDGDAAGTPPSNIDVNTPKLREQKAELGIEPCVPGDGSSDLPSLTLACLGGGPSVDLSTLSGPLVINLWASNCNPCRDEMPALQAFHERYGDRVPILGIDITDTQPEAALGLAEITGATYPQLADPGGELYSQPDLPIRPALPTFLFVRDDGTVTRQAGGVDSVAEVEAMVEEQLGITL